MTFACFLAEMVCALSVPAQINVLLKSLDLARVNGNDELDQRLGVLAAVLDMNLTETCILDNVFKLLPGVEFLKATKDRAPLRHMRLLCILLDAAFEGPSNLPGLNGVSLSELLVKVLFGRPVEDARRESAGLLTLFAL